MVRRSASTIPKNTVAKNSSSASKALFSMQSRLSARTASRASKPREAYARSACFASPACIAAWMPCPVMSTMANDVRPWP